MVRSRMNPMIAGNTQSPSGARSLRDHCSGAVPGAISRVWPRISKPPNPAIYGAGVIPGVVLRIIRDRDAVNPGTSSTADSRKSARVALSVPGHTTTPPLTAPRQHAWALPCTNRFDRSK